MVGVMSFLGIALTQTMVSALYHVASSLWLTTHFFRKLRFDKNNIKTLILGSSNTLQRRLRVVRFYLNPSTFRARSYLNQSNNAPQAHTLFPLSEGLLSLWRQMQISTCRDPLGPIHSSSTSQLRLHWAIARCWPRNSSQRMPRVLGDRYLRQRIRLSISTSKRDGYHDVGPTSTSGRHRESVCLFDG